MTYLSVAHGPPCNYKMTVRTNAFAPPSFGNLPVKREICIATAALTLVKIS